MKNAIGQEIRPGDIVAYSRRVSSSLYIERRKVHSVEEGKGVKMYATVYRGGGHYVDSEKPTGQWANPGSMAVIAVPRD